MKTLYLLVDIFTVIIPLLFSFHPTIKFYKSWNAFFMAAVLVAVLFIIWDAIFTHYGVWNFNPKYIIGLYIFQLPVEELLFFICIPFSCVFTYYCLNKFYNLAWKPKWEKIFCILLSIFLLLTGLLYQHKLYTSVTFISTAVVCLLSIFVFKINWFGKAASVYALLLIPFLIVNGILTGTGLPQPVVRYNNSENLGIRLLTIPVEDIFYGFELFLLNLLLYLHFSNKSKSSKRQAVNTIEATMAAYK